MEPMRTVGGRGGKGKTQDGAASKSDASIATGNPAVRARPCLSPVTTPKPILVNDAACFVLWAWKDSASPNLHRKGKPEQSNVGTSGRCTSASSAYEATSR